MLTTIYALIDPISKEIRYIGKTSGSLETRLKQHLNIKDSSYKKRWINQLQSKGVNPEIIEIEQVLDANGDDAEKYWITYMRSMGCRLTNLTDGGDGGRWSTKLRDRMKGRIPWNKGKTHSEETKEKLRQSALRQFSNNPGPNKGRKFSEESRRKMSQSRKKFLSNGGKVWNAENKGYKLNMTPEQIQQRNAKVWESRRRNGTDKHSEETKKRISHIKTQITKQERRL